MAEEPQEAGAVIAEVIEAELAAEDARRASVEQRGLSVLTSSGTLVTLMLGLAALVTKASGFKLTILPLVFLLLALALFLAASIQGILANRPVNYERIDPQELQSLEGDLSIWRGPREAVDRRLAEAKLESLLIAVRETGRKLSNLEWAIRCEVMAVAFLAAGVVAILVGQ